MIDPENRSEAPNATEEVQLLFVRHENSIRAFVGPYSRLWLMQTM